MAEALKSVVDGAKAVAETVKATIAGEPSVAKEQEINPWSVEAATDAQGRVVSFDYEAISRLVYRSWSRIELTHWSIGSGIHHS